ncbi:MAG: hypothetical protein QXG86_00605 [Candidatus Woesearchaeota archaeon]
MIIITVKPTKAELVDFSISDETAEFNIFFDDGQERKISFRQNINNSEELAEKMIAEMRAMSKKYHQKYLEDADDILVVRFDNEDEVVKKLTRFFEKVKDNIKSVKQLKDARGYLDTVTRAKKIEMSLI